MPPRAADFASITIPHASGVVEALVDGEGPPVVLVHASGMGAARWARLAGRLVEDYTVYAPQLPGYGGSGPFDRATWTLDDDVAAMRAVVEYVGPAHLVGHSYGGWVALQVARLCPDALITLSVYEPTTMGLLHEAGDTEGLADLARFYDDPWFRDPAHGGGDRWLGAFVDYWNQTDFWAVMGPEQRAPLQAVGAKVFAEVTAVLDDRTGRAAWAEVRVPTRVLHGARTTPAADRSSRLLVEALPAADAVEIGRAGHMAPLVRVGPIGAALVEHFERG